MLRLVFVGVILAGGLTGAVFSRYIGLLLYMWFAIFRPQEWLWTDVRDMRASMIIGILFVVPALLTGVWPNVTHRLSKALLAFIVMAVLAQTTAFDTELGWNALSQFLRLAIVALLAVTVIDTRERLLYAVLVVAASLGFHSAKSGLAVLIGGGGQLYEGIGGAFNDNNGFAAGAAMIIPLLIACAQTTPRRWLRYGLYFSALLSVVTIMGTFSRGGIIGLAVATIAFVLLQRRRSWAVVGLAATIAIGAVALPISDAYVNRVRTISTTPQDSSALGRLHFWRVAMDMAKDRPFGVGMGNYEAAYDRYDFSGGQFGRGRAVHSSFFQVIAETGFGGFAAYIVVLGLSFATAWRIRRASFAPERSPDDQRYLFTLGNGLLVSFVAFAAAGSFVSLAFNDVTWFSVALLAALDRLTAQPAEATASDAATDGALLPSAPQPAAYAYAPFANSYAPEMRAMPVRTVPPARRAARAAAPAAATGSGLDLFLPASAHPPRDNGSR